MANFVCHKDDLFFTFSTVSDMVSSPVLPRAEFEAYMLEMTRLEEKDKLAPRIERALLKGSSSCDSETVYDVVRHNAERLSLKKILKRRGRPGGMTLSVALDLLKAGSASGGRIGGTAGSSTSWSGTRASSSPTRRASRSMPRARTCSARIGRS